MLPTNNASGLARASAGLRGRVLLGGQDGVQAELTQRCFPMLTDWGEADS